MRSNALLWSARTTAGQRSMASLLRLAQNASTALAASPRTSAHRGPMLPNPRGPAPARCS
eukprot:6682752-Heterocapsa_arctica.AAC.1